ncbi:MAG: HDIG domain-containing protein [Candidatus Bathyarchaeota archaeon]|nr:HDIG domain-containing protein [Candidatus Bathyarchaeota archaeon]
MIGLDEADHLASASSRYHHMQLVSVLMSRTAKQLTMDQALWCLIGLLHDIDYDETKSNREKHGLLASQRLEGRLPREGLDAIRRHDHRAGLTPETDIDFALILCDAVGLILEESGARIPVSLDDFTELSEKASSQKPWLWNLVFENPLLDRIDLSRLLEFK